MKKKWFVLLIVLALVGILAFTLAACNDDEEGPPADDGKVTVTFVQGDRTLRTEQVEKGSAAAAFKDYVPEIEGYDFLGWYAAPSLMIPFDFDTVVFNENTTIFAKAASTDQPVARLRPSNPSRERRTLLKSRLTFTKETSSSSSPATRSVGSISVVTVTSKTRRSAMSPTSPATAVSATPALAERTRRCRLTAITP